MEKANVVNLTEVGESLVPESATCVMMLTFSYSCWPQLSCLHSEDRPCTSLLENLGAPNIKLL